MDQVMVTPDNRGPAINLVNWVIMVIMVLASFTKVFTNLLTMRSLSKDSILVLVAMIMAIGQSVAVTEQVGFGLGKRARALTDSQLEGFQKAGYASQMLYIGALCFNKMATLYFVATLARTDTSRAAIRGSMAVTTVWAVTAIFGIAFQCQPPQTWAIATGKCFNQSAFWDVIGTVDIIIDAFIVWIPLFVLWDLQMAWSRKATVMAAFVSRALIIPLTILRLVFISSAKGSSDHPFDDFNTAIATQVGMHSAIILTCFPFLKTFMDHVQHGVFTSDLRMAPGGNSNSGNSYAMNSINGRYHKSSPSSSGVGKGSVSSTVRWFKGKDIDTSTTRGAGAESPSSAGSDKLIIKRTTDFILESHTTGEGASSSGRPSAVERVERVERAPPGERV